MLFKTDAGKTPTDWSPSGYLAYTSRNDVWALSLPLSGNSEPLQVTNTSFHESDARISPNGRWIAYQSNESASEGQQTCTSSLSRSRDSDSRCPREAASSRAGARTDGALLPPPDLTLMSVSIESVDARLRLCPPVRCSRRD